MAAAGGTIAVRPPIRMRVEVNRAALKAALAAAPGWTAEAALLTATLVNVDSSTTAAWNAAAASLPYTTFEAMLGAEKAVKAILALGLPADKQVALNAPRKPYGAVDSQEGERVRRLKIAAQKTLSYFWRERLLRARFPEETDLYLQSLKRSAAGGLPADDGLELGSAGADVAALEDVSFALLAALLIGHGAVRVGAVYGALGEAVKAHAVAAGATGGAAAPPAPGALPPDATAPPLSPTARKSLAALLARLVGERDCVPADLVALSEYFQPPRLVALAVAPIFAPVRAALSTAAVVHCCSYMSCDSCGGGNALCLRAVGCAPPGLPPLIFSGDIARAAAGDCHAEVGFDMRPFSGFDVNCAGHTFAAFVASLFRHDVDAVANPANDASASRCGGCSRIVTCPAATGDAEFVRDPVTVAALEAAQGAQLPAVQAGGGADGEGGVPIDVAGAPAAAVPALVPTAAALVSRLLRSGRDPLVGERPGIPSLFVEGSWACAVCAASFDSCVNPDGSVTGKLDARDKFGGEEVCVTCCAQKSRNLTELCSASGSVCGHFQCAPCTLVLPAPNRLRLQASLSGSADPLPCPVCAPHAGPYAPTLLAATRLRRRSGEAAVAATDVAFAGSGFELSKGAASDAARFRSYVWTGAQAASVGGDSAYHALRESTFGASATREGYTTSRRFFSEAQLTRITREGMTLVELCSGLCSFSLAALLSGWPIKEIVFVEREANLHKPLEAWTRAHAREFALGRAPVFTHLSDNMDSLTAAIAAYRAAGSDAERAAVKVAHSERPCEAWLPLSYILGCHGALSGPPCQDHSGANSAGMGLAGPKGRYTLSAADALRFLAEEPARRGADPNASCFVALENVKGLSRDERLEVSRTLGLPAELCVSSNHGRAHTKRERVFFSVVPLSLSRPLPPHNVTLRDVVAHYVGVEPRRIAFVHGVVAGAGNEVLAATMRTDGYASISFSPSSPPSRKWQLYWVVRGVNGERDSPPVSAPLELYALLQTFPADLSVRSLGYTPSAPAQQRSSVSESAKLHAQFRACGNSIVVSALKVILGGLSELDAHFAAVCGPSWTFNGFTWLPPGTEAAEAGVEQARQEAARAATAEHARLATARVEALRRAVDEDADEEEGGGSEAAAALEE